MKIVDEPSGRVLESVGIELTLDEARELRDKVQHMVQAQVHVADEAFSVEVTLWIEGHP